ncbi:MAG: hypothetical protein ACFFC1_20835 [Promethearchaeota archaeon]
MSNNNSVFDELVPSDDISLQQILNNLLDGKHNLDLKTQIVKPKVLASLKIFAELLGKLKYPKSEQVLESFIKTYLRYMVSFERQSRKEIIKAVSSLFESESKDILSKMTKNLA